MTGRRVPILGICEIDDVTEAGVLAQLHIARDGGKAIRALQINVANLHHARRSSELRALYEGADLVTADGVGIYWGTRLLGHRLVETITGIGLMHRLLAECARRGERVFLLGAQQEVVEKASSEVERLYGPVVAGFRNGYFNEEMITSIADEIATSRADYVLVGMSTPLKERWIMKHGPRHISHIGVGGSFDVLAGKARRAPEWVQKLGLEWLFRLLQEPRRLWKRYLFGNSWFIAALTRELLRTRLVKAVKEIDPRLRG